MIVRFDHGRVTIVELDIGVQPKNKDQLELCLFLQDRVGLQLVYLTILGVENRDTRL